MSYSRWGGSKWYAFWNTYSGETRNTQILSLWHSIGEDNDRDFYYKELKDGILNSPEKVRAFYGNIPDNDIDEMKNIIARFIEDVEAEPEENLKKLSKREII